MAERNVMEHNELLKELNDLMERSYHIGADLVLLDVVEQNPEDLANAYPDLVRAYDNLTNWLDDIFKWEVKLVNWRIKNKNLNRETCHRFDVLLYVLTPLKESYRKAEPKLKKEILKFEQMG